MSTNQMINVDQDEVATDTFVLSVLVPVYNEVGTIREIIRRILTAPYDKEIIIVDDASTDGTAEILRNEYSDRSDIRLVFQDRNQGKGCALRAAIPLATGDVTIIQDADLEYDPTDFSLLVEVIRRGESDIAYGSRYMTDANKVPWTKFRMGVSVLNWMVRVLYDHPMTDEATCYKAWRTELLQDIDLTCRRFEFCPEVTAKCIRRGHRIVEVPIRYEYRSVEAGKKIGWRDGIDAMWCLLKWRVLSEKRTDRKSRG
jgi:glycosyltransferase involved in cell wall biosynthesis